MAWSGALTENCSVIFKGAERAPKPRPKPGAWTWPPVSDGRWVSFVRGYDLWAVSVTAGQEKQLTHGGREELRNGQLDWVYPEELDIRTAYWWSPDSSQIAYLQMDEQPVTKYPLVNFLSY